MKQILFYFKPREWCLWGGSVGVILLSALWFPNGDVLTTLTSLLGVTSLIFCAKGHPVGQLLMVIFGLLYGVISYGMQYYGEMVTYMGMTVPMAVYALICWLKNPYRGKKSQVAINRIPLWEVWLLCGLTLIVTVLFYFVLKFFHTANLGWSTLSVATSFSACYLTARRSPYYALCYALNDVVLIVLWVAASIKEIAYLGVVICFLVFLVNDLYGFFNWKKMWKRQQNL